MQNTKNVKNSKDLNNKFKLYAAFSFSDKTQSQFLYDSKGQISSFNDYNNDGNIDFCTSFGRKCLY